MASPPSQVYWDLFNLLNLPIPTPPTGSLVFFISVITSFLSTKSFFEDSIIVNFFLPHANEYDFIIVGGGSAGSVAANRLSENGKYSVLLLEAGGDPNILNSIPELAPYNLHNAGTDWSYKTVPQENACLAMYNKELRWPRGKVLGGCSTLNWMIYQRGHPKDYEQWKSATKSEEWSYDNLLPFFMKSENYHGWYPNPKFHGNQGPLDVSSQAYHPSLEQWLESGKERGFDPEKDPNAYQEPGLFKMDTTIFQGQRESTFRAFLQPITGRNNLVISRYSHVTKINVDSTLKAYGVSYVKEGRKFFARAKKEIILSAGAVGTPQLLMLSGIGPKDHLNSVGINPIVDLPGVGSNLQDHVLTLFGPFLLNSSISFLTDRDLTLNTAVEYVTSQTGPFAFNELSGIGFISTTQSSDKTWPNIEFHHSPIGMRMSVGDDYSSVFGVPPSILSTFYAQHLGLDSNFVLVDLGRPKSTGDIKLKNADPFTYPIIDPKYYTVQEDIDAMVEALEFLVDLYEKTEAWQKVGARLIPGKLPGCEQHQERSKAYFECYLRHLTFTIYHPCCTAKMGTVEDKMSVLDSNLRVKGISGLRVADASVFPVITNANLNAPSIVVGEKVSDFILKSLVDNKRL